jgi:hypothetical protein
MARRDGDENERPVLPWRLVVGILLHFAIPLYLIVLLAAFLFLPDVPASAEARVRWVLHASGLFVAGFFAAILLAGIVTAAIDPLLRRFRRRKQARDPNRVAIASRQEAALALARIGATDWGAAGARVMAAVERLKNDPWDHDDGAGQRLAKDLAEAANAFVPALASAHGAKRADLAELAATALERIADALERQAADRGRLDEGDARTIARLIDLRYGDNVLPDSLEGGSKQD